MAGILNNFTVFTTVATFLRFIVPVGKTSDDWSAYNSELKSLLDPIHHALASDLVPPHLAGDQIGTTLKNFLLSKSEFSDSDFNTKSPGYISHEPKSLQKVTSIKNRLRKLARKSKDPQERKKFYDALRAHSYLKKQNDKKEKSKTGIWQETLYRKNFFEFAKSSSNGTLGDSSTFPAFDKRAADTFYQTRYSKATPVNTENLKWYTEVNNPINFHPFCMDPFKPKDIRNLIKSKSSKSSPGPDGITYGLLKKLPCVHHILATLYSKLLISPSPPPSWADSKITLIFKKGETKDPRNFRMIALSSVLGKTFHLLLAHRITTFLTENSFIDKTIQKAFIQKVNGVIEHNQCLHEIIDHARAKKRTAHMTFFDLEDAFGSVQHNLISHSLLRYRIPRPVHDYIMNLYSMLNGTVTTKNWFSNKFNFKKGVFQGDPLSPIIFLAVFNPLLEKLLKESKFGYKINDVQYITTPFADDFNLITTNKRTHQRLINKIHEWSKSMGLTLKPIKCKSLSIVSGQAQVLSFNLGPDVLGTLEDDHHKFLGSIVTFSNKQSEILNTVYTHFESRLENIDNLLLRNEYKVKLYSNYVLPSSKFILSVHTLTSKSLDKLDALATRYLKRWIGLPRSGTPAVIHVPNIYAIKSIRHVYKECQASAYISSKLQADSKVKNALDSRLEREQHWTRKMSTTVICDKVFKKVKEQNVKQDARNIKKAAKIDINKEMQLHWSSHLKSLVVQGRFLTANECMNEDINFKSIIHDLPRNVAKFLTNACIDTLPTNSNLLRWKKRNSPACKLCGNKETLLHVLNNCKLMLNQGRYTWRHNSVLNFIYNALKPKESNLEFHVDLPGSLTGISTIPIDIVITLQRPDLVIIDRKKNKVYVIELTIPFDINVNDAHKRKSNKYENLVNDIKEAGYETAYHAIEIGSRGYVTKDNRKRLLDIINITGQISKKEFNVAINNIKKTAILASYCVFYSKYESSWIEPRLLTV